MKLVKKSLVLIIVSFFFFACQVGYNDYNKDNNESEESIASGTTEIKATEQQIGGGVLINNSSASVHCRYDKNGITYRLYCPSYTDANSYFNTVDIDYFTEPATGKKYKINAFGSVTIGYSGLIDSYQSISRVNSY